MTQPDEFGHDPAVQMMRRVFNQMETRQGKIIDGKNLSPFDPRLRRVREMALQEFERTWTEKARSNTPMTEADYANLYEDALLKNLKGVL